MFSRWSHCSQTPAPPRADTADRLLQLLSVPGVAGYEAAVREAIEMLLPAGARVRADSLGNILIRTGNGNPHTLIVAPLDEPGFVVSAITSDGYLRVHQHTPTSLRLSSQFFIGQPVQIHAANGTVDRRRDGDASVHLSAFRDREDETRIKTIDESGSMSARSRVRTWRRPGFVCSTA